HPSEVLLGSAGGLVGLLAGVAPRTIFRENNLSPLDALLITRKEARASRRFFQARRLHAQKKCREVGQASRCRLPIARTSLRPGDLERTLGPRSEQQVVVPQPFLAIYPDADVDPAQRSRNTHRVRPVLKKMRHRHLCPFIRKAERGSGNLLVMGGGQASG